MLFCFAFVTAGAYVVVRTVADALFLTHVGVQHLPTMHLIATSLVVAMTVLSLSWGNRPRSLSSTLLLLAFATLAVPLLERFSGDSVVMIGTLYVLAQLHGTVGTILITILLNEHFHGNAPPRVFGIVAAGATCAAIAFGSGLAAAVSWVGPLNLLYMVVALDLLAMIPIGLLSAQSPTNDADENLDDDLLQDGTATIGFAVTIGQSHPAVSFH